MSKKTKKKAFGQSQDVEMDNELNQVEELDGQAEMAAENKEDYMAEKQENANNEISALELENEKLKNTVLRRMAELENVKKRVQRERVMLFDEAKTAAIKDFLPIYDDLLRAIEVSGAENKEVQDGLLTGVKLVVDKFNLILKKYEVEPIDEINIPFDVDVHDALLKQPAPSEDVESNTVIQVLERGYKMGGKTINHAKVIVSE